MNWLKDWIVIAWGKDANEIVKWKTKCRDENCILDNGHVGHCKNINGLYFKN